MTVALRAAPAHAAIVGPLEAALAAAHAGDDAALELALEGVLANARRPLAEGVEQLAREVRDTLRQLDLDSRILGLAEGEIRDARGHLDHVVRMTESAAHRTLDLVEESRVALDALAARHALAAADESLAQLRSNLLSVAMAQEYQDLTGQIIRRVIALVASVESALDDLVSLAGPALKQSTRAPLVPAPSAASDLKGPSAAHSASQQDADDLLADLGF